MTFPISFRILVLAFVTFTLAGSVASPLAAHSHERVRTLTCSDETTFDGVQVRKGWGIHPPATWRNVNPGEFPTAFVFLSTTIKDPSGAIVEESSYDHKQGIDINRDLATCWVFIPLGAPFYPGHTVYFEGYFVP